MNLRDLFQNDVASTAFKIVDGEKRIIGKFGQLSIVDGVFDIWFVGLDFSPLSTLRLNSAAKKLGKEADIHMLTGEMWLQTADLALARKAISLLGIKKKRQYSEETKKRLRERLAKVRNAS